MLHSRNPSLQTLSRGLDRGTGASGGERANGWGAKSSTLLQDDPQRLLTNLSPCLQKRDNSFFHSRVEAE